MVPYVIIEWSLIPEILRIPKVLKLAPIGDYLKLFTRIWAYLSGVGGGGYFEGGGGMGLKVMVKIAYFQSGYRNYLNISDKSLQL